MRWKTQRAFVISWANHCGQPLRLDPCQLEQMLSSLIGIWIISTPISCASSKRMLGVYCAAGTIKDVRGAGLQAVGKVAMLTR